MSSVIDTREVQDLQCHPSKSCQHLLLWADTLRSTISCLFSVFQVGGEGTPWIPSGSSPLPPRSPAPPFRRHRSTAHTDLSVTAPTPGRQRGSLRGWSPSWMSPWHMAGEGQGCARSQHRVPAWCIPTAACKSIFCDFHSLALNTTIVVAKIK